MLIAGLLFNDKSILNNHNANYDNLINEINQIQQSKLKQFTEEEMFKELYSKYSIMYPENWTVV